MSGDLRQACFEPFYRNEFLTKASYLHFLDEVREGSAYFQHAAFCALGCPAEFTTKREGVFRLAKEAGERALNRGELDAFAKRAFAGGPIILRSNCLACPVKPPPVDKPRQFFILFAVYLRARNLGRDAVEDHYLLFALCTLIHIVTLEMIGISWLGDEATLPPAAEWDDMPRRYVEKMNSITYDLITYIKGYLEREPLPR